MSEAADLLAEGFAEFLCATDSPTLTVGAVTVPCIAPPMVRSKKLKDAGFWQSLTCRAELLRTDAARIGMQDHLELIYMDARGVRTRARVMAIDDDSVDPCITVTLVENPAT